MNMDLMLFILVIMVIMICYYTYFKDQKKFGHIPGPRKIPIFGDGLHLRQTDDNRKSIPLPQQLTALAKKHGEVMWINMGFTNFVVVSGYNAMFEALVTKGADFADRTTSAYRLRVLNLQNTVVGMGYTRRFKVIKGMLYRALRLYGGTVDQLESVVIESLDNLTNVLQSKEGKPILVNETFMQAFANTVHILIFGRQLESSGTAYSSLMKLNEVMFDAVPMTFQGTLLDRFPILRYAFRGMMEKLDRYVKMRHDFWDDMIKNHKMNWDGEETGCLLDVLLKYRITEEQDGVQLSDEELVYLVDNFFIAGYLGSGATMSGLILLCLYHPSIQEKIYSEVCSVVGATGYIGIKHKAQLHYTRAVVFEALRYISFSALSPFPFHQTTKDTSINGYFIPKATQVMMNQWAVHHDADFWVEPWSFQPERFLDDNGRLLPPDHPNRRRMLAFGAGERVCVGEVFALNRLCMFLSTLVQRFHFEVDDVSTLPSPDPRDWPYSAAMLLMPPFQAKFVPRK